VVRGGSYNHGVRHIRCAARAGIAAGARDVYIGFRVAVSGRAQRITNPAFEWVTVSAGAFLMGSNAATRSSAVLSSEMPQQRVHLAEFHLAQTPVTNADYEEFVRAAGQPAPSHWFDGIVPAGLERHPVTHVDWHDVQAFCRWAGVRLPTEAEWEMAARGSTTDNAKPRIYPWGNDRPDDTRLNYRRNTKRVCTTPVDHYPRGASPFGVLDMAGNVWEWVSSIYARYPYSAQDGREDPQSNAPRALRGGSFASPNARFVRCAMRSLSYPTRRREHIGFRVAQ
jgi:formylglycine-generating enzyme required for sulfatase activity